MPRLRAMDDPQCMNPGDRPTGPGEWPTLRGSADAMKRIAQSDPVALRPVEPEPGVLVHPSADRRLAVEHWLLSTIPTPQGRAQARLHWREQGVAMLPLTSIAITTAMPSAGSRVCRSGRRGPAQAKTSKRHASPRSVAPPQTARHARPPVRPSKPRTSLNRTAGRRRHTHHHATTIASGASHRNSGFLNERISAMSSACATRQDQTRRSSFSRDSKGSA